MTWLRELQQIVLQDRSVDVGELKFNAKRGEESAKKSYSNWMLISHLFTSLEWGSRRRQA